MPLVYEGQVPATFAPAVADITAPTEAEVAAGKELSCYIPKDGVQFPSNRNMVPTGALCDTFDSEFPGSDGGTLVVTFKRQDRNGDSAAWDAFKAGVVEGYLIFGFEGSNDEAGDEVDVYHVVGHKPVRGNPAANTEQRFSVNFGVQQWALAATVAAGGS